MHDRSTLLYSASVDVSYEMWMLHRTGLMVLALEGEPGVMRNAILESFLVHARVIDDFLTKESGHLDDVLAKDYVSTGEWAPREVLGKDARKWINKKIAHLSTLRSEKEPWWLGEMAVSLASAFIDFYRAVSDPQYKAAFDKAADSAFQMRRDFDGWIEARADHS